MGNIPTKAYILTDEQLEVIFDRLSRFRDDQDAQAIGHELARQQSHNPNHSDETIFPIK